MVSPTLPRCVQTVTCGAILAGTMNAAKRARPVPKSAEPRAPYAAVFIALTILAGCSSVPIPATYTQDELKVECDRHRGWWRPDDLRGGYCDFRGP